MSGLSAKDLFQQATEAELKKLSKLIARQIKSLTAISANTLESDTQPLESCVTYCRQNWRLIITKVEKARLCISTQLTNEIPQVRDSATGAIFNNILLILLATATNLQHALNSPTAINDYTADDTRAIMAVIEGTERRLIDALKSLPTLPIKQLESHGLFFIKAWEQQLEFESKIVTTWPLEEAVSALAYIEINMKRIEDIFILSDFKLNSFETKSYTSGKYHINYKSIDEVYAYSAYIPTLNAYRDLLLRVEDKVFALEEARTDEEVKASESKPELTDLKLIAVALKIRILEVLALPRCKALGVTIRAAFAFDTASPKSDFETNCLYLLMLNKDQLPNIISNDPDLMKRIDEENSFSITKEDLVKKLDTNISEHLTFYKSENPQYITALTAKKISATPVTPSPTPSKPITPRTTTPLFKTTSTPTPIPSAPTTPKTPKRTKASNMARPLTVGNKLQQLMAQRKRIKVAPDKG